MKTKDNDLHWDGFRSETRYGTYTIEIDFPEGYGSPPRVLKLNGEILSLHADIPSAKAAAQSHHDQLFPEIPIEILDRYLSLIDEDPICEPEPGTSLPHLAWMLQEIREGKVREDKAHRWLGFVQGVLILSGLTGTTRERDFTRPFFNR